MDDELLFKKVTCYVTLSIALAFSLPVISARLLEFGFRFSELTNWGKAGAVILVIGLIGADIYIITWLVNAAKYRRFKSGWLEEALFAFGCDAFLQFKYGEGFTLSWITAGAVLVAWICSLALEVSAKQKYATIVVAQQPKEPPRTPMPLPNVQPQPKGEIAPFYTPDGVMRGYMFDGVVYATCELAEAEQAKNTPNSQA